MPDDDSTGFKTTVTTDVAHTNDRLLADDLDAGDVVVFRSPWSPEDRPAWGVVRAGGPDGPRVVSPRFVDGHARLAGSLSLERVSFAETLLGVDTEGDAHLIRADPLRATWGRPGDACTYPLAAEGRSVVDWIRHVDRKRGWAEPSARARELLKECDRR